jgi:transcriptional regulator with XRE-family HTH domain
MTAAVQFGQMLRDARELRGLTPQQLASETRIPLGHVEALEAGLLHAIPGGLYLRAEARSYAEAVALDPQLVLGALKDALAADPGARAPDRHGPAWPAGPSVTIHHRADRMWPVPLAAPAVPRRSSGQTRDPRAYWGLAVVLVLGAAALLFEQSGRSPSVESDVPRMAAADVPLDPAQVLDEVVRIIDPTPLAPALSRTLFASEPSAARSGPAGGRLDSGRLVVQSTPAGARVTVNGVGWGVTPVAIRYLPFGTMRVRLVKENYRAAERLVELTPGAPASTMRVTLPRIPGRPVDTARASAGPMLVVNTTPPGARVTVNGIGWGSTPVTIPHLPLGAQRLRVVKEQFISEERVVQLAEGQSRQITIALRRADAP